MHPSITSALASVSRRAISASRGALYQAVRTLVEPSLAFTEADVVAQLTRNVPRKLLIGGNWVAAKSGKTMPVIDPRTEEVVLEVAEADAADVHEAVKAARHAFDHGPWPKMTGHERAKVIWRLADLLEANAEEFAQLETLDNGKPISYSRAADVPLSYEHFRYFAGWADKLHGKTIPCDGPFLAYTFHEPIGVVGQIIPWNFPLLMAVWKLAPALSCGNAVVLKVAEQTPMTALRLGQLALEAGVPPGVLNVLPGYGPTAGAALVNHPGVDKIAFTGSSEVGRLVGKAAAEHIKPCTLELGGKSPIVVAPDMPVDEAVKLAHFALFFNHGQCCAAGSRLYVHESMYEEFVEKSGEAALQRRVGNPFSDVDQGPQVDKDQYNKILGYIQVGQEQGARLVAGGGAAAPKGFYIQPTVFADVKEDMRIAREEIFGPVQTILKYKNMDEVITRVNDNNFGLASGVFSKNIDTINRLTRAIRAGTVWVNTYNVYDAAVPFGGYKDSGVGREKGEYALSAYTQVKAVYMPLENSAWR